MTTTTVLPLSTITIAQRSPRYCSAWDVAAAMWGRYVGRELDDDADDSTIFLVEYWNGGKRALCVVVEEGTPSVYICTQVFFDGLSRRIVIGIEPKC